MPNRKLWSIVTNQTNAIPITNPSTFTLEILRVETHVLRSLPLGYNLHSIQCQLGITKPTLDNILGAENIYLNLVYYKLKYK